MLSSSVQNMQKYSLFLHILFIMGCPGLIRNPNYLLNILNKSSVLLLWICHLHNISMFVCDITKCYGAKCAKVNVTSILFRSFLIQSWITLYLKRKDLQKLTHVITKYHIKNIKCPVLLFNAVVIVFLLSSSVVLTGAVVVLWNQNATIDRWFKRLSFGMNSDHRIMKFAYVSGHMFINKIFSHILPILLCLFYSSLCYGLIQMIKECRDLLTCSKESFDVVQKFINFYSTVHDLSAYVESTISSHVFWLISALLLTVFNQLSKMLSYYKFYPSLFIEETYFQVLGDMSVFLVPYFASKASEEDSKLRRKVKNIAFKMRLSKETELHGNVLSNIIHYKAAIVFTANGLFAFKKSFLLNSLGILLTYNILYLQFF